MNKLITALLTICMSSSVFAWGQNKKPQISEVFVDQELNLLTITGNNFQNPDVSLGEYGAFLTYVSSTGDYEWVVELPTEILDGDYKLTVSQGWRGYYRADYDLTIGTDGLDLLAELCDLYTLTGHPLPAVCPPPHPSSFCQYGRPRAILFKFTPESCAENFTNPQNGTASCLDYSLPTSPVHITVYKNASEKYYDTIIGVGTAASSPIASNATFTADATNAGKSALPGSIGWEIRNAAGTVIYQTGEIHTSCSQPIWVGDGWGSLNITGGISESGDVIE